MKSFQQKQSTDEAVYRRALQSDDPAMKKYVQWYDNGKKVVDQGTPTQVKARWVVVDMLNKYEDKYVKDELDIHCVLISKIIRRRYKYFPEDTAQRILEYGIKNGYGNEYH